MDELKPCFTVIDNTTGQEPDQETIALKEEWAKGLLYCDMEGFAIQEDGTLILMDECGKFVYCPEDRFTVHFTGEETPAALTAELSELRSTYQLMSDAGARAVRLWREKHPDQDIWPDMAANMVWLMEHCDTMRAERDAAHKSALAMKAMYAMAENERDGYKFQRDMAREAQIEREARKENA